MSVTDDESDRAEGVAHPRYATQLIGHAADEASLLDAYRQGRLPHAIVLGGPEGIGKATLAWRLAKFILTYSDPESAAVRAARTLEVPTTSHAASQVLAMAHPDLALLRREMNEKTKRFYTEIRADDVRRVIGLFQRAAGAGGYRIALLDCAEDLNRSSANALLKLIEEPPPRALFLIVAHRPGLMLPTLRSRTRLVRLMPLSASEISGVVTTLGAPWTDMGLSTIGDAAQRAQGSVRTALRLLGHRGVELDAAVERLLDRLPAIEWREVHKLAEAVAGRDGEAAYETTMTAIYEWLQARVRRQAQSAPRRLAPYAEVWEKIAQSARETEALNLDKRPLILSLFTDLSTAVRASSA